jgi:hypothetical protein
MPAIIDLASYIGKSEKALVGRDNGEAVKNKLLTAGYDFEALEKAGGQIQIKIPPEVVTINKSFFLGLFELNIQRLGADGFSEKYLIDATDHIRRKIADHVQAAMLKASQKDILNG